MLRRQDDRIDWKSSEVFPSDIVLKVSVSDEDKVRKTCSPLFQPHLQLSQDLGLLEENEEGAVVEFFSFTINLCLDVLKLEGGSIFEGIVGFRAQVFAEMLLLINCEVLLLLTALREIRTCR